MFHGFLWNNLLDFSEKSGKFLVRFRSSAAVRGRFLKIAVYFFGIRLFVWNFVGRINLGYE